VYSQFSGAHRPLAGPELDVASARLTEHARSSAFRGQGQHGVEARAIEMPPVQLGMSEETGGIQPTGSPSALNTVHGLRTSLEKFFPHSEPLQADGGGRRKGLADPELLEATLFE
jgi:hypothetical protein